MLMENGASLMVWTVRGTGLGRWPLQSVAEAIGSSALFLLQNAHGGTLHAQPSKPTHNLGFGLLYAELLWLCMDDSLCGRCSLAWVAGFRTRLVGTPTICKHGCEVPAALIQIGPKINIWQ